MKKSKKQKDNKLSKGALSHGNEGNADMKSAPYDPNGMWTGYPIPPFETPEQDADDLQFGTLIVLYFSTIGIRFVYYIK